MTPEFIAAIESERAPLGIEFGTAVALYSVDSAFRARVDEYIEAMLEAPNWFLESKDEQRRGGR